MTWIIIFLGIIAIVNIIELILNFRINSLQSTIKLTTEELNRERDQFSDAKKDFEKQLSIQKDATNLWAKKYFELEILLKKFEHKTDE